jgi:hypothetical protein
VNGARTAASSADPRIARNGGTFRNVKAMRRASGSRFSGEIQKDSPRTSCARAGSRPPLGAAFSPRTKKITRLMPMAGPAVQNMLRTCWLTVSPRPTSFGTRMVVSDSGVILSPK